MAYSQQTGNFPHFFRIIFSSTLQTGKLAIPAEFVRKYGNDMSSPANLRVPTGGEWNVELIKSDGILWLKNGWKEFSNHFSLKYGHLLVFRYEGNSNFHVTIFDRSTSEIAYPNNMLYEEEESEDDDDFEEEESKDDDSEDDDSEEEESEDDDSVQVIEEISSRREMREKPKSTRTNKNKRVCEDESNPFFEVEMTPDYIDPGLLMYIPKDFATKYLKKGSSCITLTLDDGKTWSAKCLRYVTCGRYPKAVINSGWKKFRQENKLKVGDTCVFELINPTETSFNVVIHPSPLGRRGNSMGPLTPREKARAFLRAGDFKSKRPFFKVVMQLGYVKYSRVYIPCKFIKKHLGGKEGQVILEVGDERTWTVKLSIGVMGNGQHKALFCSTWKNFAMDNGLKVGDLCIFELINRKKRFFKVSIYPAASSSSDANSSASASVSPQGM